MPLWFWVTIVLVGAGLIAAIIYIWALAVRLDRLHRRVAKMRESLQLVLIKRAAASVQLATGGSLHSAESRDLLASANRALAIVDQALPGTAEDLRRAAAQSRYIIESALSSAIRELNERHGQIMGNDPLAKAQWDDLLELCYQLQVTRTVYNQDVTLVQDLRKRHLVRVLHLAGFARLPEYVDLDDEL